MAPIRTAGVRSGRSSRTSPRALGLLQQLADESTVLGVKCLEVDAEALGVLHPCPPDVEHHAGKIVVAAKKISKGPMKRPAFAERRPAALQDFGPSGLQSDYDVLVGRSKQLFSAVDVDDFLATQARIICRRDPSRSDPARTSRITKLSR